ncbi:hypothetical protein C0992_009641 [Termitomyces sp. T32_za158]|nr:hypothetical protein C0992_009641 [Termitomyces sp. T32_za158]
MSHLSPASLLVWAILMPMLGAFLLFHLWSFDRFKCLRVTHLEELCFWLFLLNSGSAVQQNWFHSLYFKAWVTGSILALTYMPIVTVLTHSDPLKIFFPRSIEREIAARDERQRSKSRNSDGDSASFYGSRDEFSNTTQYSARTFNYGTPMPGSRQLDSTPRTTIELVTDKKAVNKASSVVRAVGEPSRSGSIDKFWADEQDTFASLPPLRPNRKKGDGVEFRGIEQVTRSNMARPIPFTSNVNHLVHNFTSPIGMSALSNSQPL